MSHLRNRWALRLSMGRGEERGLGMALGNAVGGVYEGRADTGVSRISGVWRKSWEYPPALIPIPCQRKGGGKADSGDGAPIQRGKTHALEWRRIVTAAL